MYRALKFLDHMSLKGVPVPPPLHTEALLGTETDILYFYHFFQALRDLRETKTMRTRARGSLFLMVISQGDHLKRRGNPLATGWLLSVAVSGPPTL